VAQSKKPHVLLKSSWQTVNIGDIAHTPGVLHMLECLLPEVDVKLWPSDTRNGVREMLQARFPKVEILSPSQLKQAYEACDFLGLGRKNRKTLRSAWDFTLKNDRLVKGNFESIKVYLFSRFQIFGLCEITRREFAHHGV